jgi:hypothetical protein
MAPKGRVGRTSQELERVVQRAMAKARATIRAAQGGGSRSINVAGRTNATVVVNTGKADSAQTSSAVQYAPIEQTSKGRRKEDSDGRGKRQEAGSTDPRGG